MSFWQRISRILLIVALVPMIAAAGLPLHACQCATAGSEAACACCDAANASCCGAGQCACCAAKTADADDASAACCGEKHSNPSVAQVSCQCGSEQAPQPTAPASPAIELLSPGALPTTLAVVAPLPPVVTGARERMIAASLPPVDLPTALCTLLI